MPTRRGDAAKPQARSALLAAARAGSPRGTERLAERLQLQGCCKPPVATSPPSPSVLPCFLPCWGQRPQQPGCLSSRQHASRPPACKLCVPPEEPPLAPAPPNPTQGGHRPPRRALRRPAPSPACPRPFPAAGFSQPPHEIIRGKTDGAFGNSLQINSSKLRSS